MDKKINRKLLLISLLPLAGGAVTGCLLKDSFALYKTLYKPLFSPPSWVFGPVWTLLYVMMGAALYLLLSEEADSRRKSRALRVFAAQLALNYLWPVVFFALESYWSAFAVASLLLFGVFAAWLHFAHINKTSGRLLVPYLLWSFYALYLSLGVALLN